MHSGEPWRLGERGAGALPPGIALRPVTPGDADLLLRIYAASREEELALVDWPAERRDAFLRMQLAAQTEHWNTHYPHADRSIVTADGVPAGRLYLDRRSDEIRIVDIALLPERRGAGLGTALLRPILDEGSRLGVPVTIHVERNNPAQRLYHRLGFRLVEDRGVYLFLGRPPDQPNTAS